MDLTKPVIAAIEGWCVAGGLELALMADLRIADSDSKLGVLNRRFGVPLIDGGTVRSVDFNCYVTTLGTKPQWFELLMPYSIRSCWGVTNKLSKKESCIFVGS